MDFILTGFRQESSFRHYAFKSISVSKTTEAFTVGADLNLVYKHKIPLQELPLLCKRLLEATEEPRTHSLIFTEADMLSYTKRRAASQLATELKRKKHRAPISDRVGQAWRGIKPDSK